ncbi:MAG TPA: glutathione S-transferase family protein [Rhodanobacteraceae bacterium]|nr:glutathione S-transferase family protein [Rhodanobacteraceae bacterium]
MKQITVWGFTQVPPAAQGLVRDLRVRWALREAGLAYESRSIAPAERKAAAWQSKHPFGMVPAIEADGEIRIESGAIVHAIAEQCEALMPLDLRTETITWMFAALNTVEPPLWNLFLMDELHQGEEWVKLRRAGAVDEARARLRALAEWLQDRDYLLGCFTAADILMTTVLRFIRHTDLLAEFPTLAAYVERCEARPAFLSALREQLAEYERQAAIAA